MAISVECPACFQVYRVKSEFVGRTIRCKNPDCGERLRVERHEHIAAPQRTKKRKRRAPEPAAPPSGSGGKYVLVGSLSLIGVLFVGTMAYLVISRIDSPQQANRRVEKEQPAAAKDVEPEANEPEEKLRVVEAPAGKVVAQKDQRPEQGEQSPVSIPDLIRQLHSADQQTSDAAMETLASLGNKCVEPLVAGLHQATEVERMRVFNTLSKMEGSVPGAVPTLLKAIQWDDEAQADMAKQTLIEVVDSSTAVVPDVSDNEALALGAMIQESLDSNALFSDQTAEFCLWGAKQLADSGEAASAVTTDLLLAAIELKTKADALSRRALRDQQQSERYFVSKRARSGQGTFAGSGRADIPSPNTRSSGRSSRGSSNNPLDLVGKSDNHIANRNETKMRNMQSSSMRMSQRSNEMERVVEGLLSALDEIGKTKAIYLAHSISRSSSSPKALMRHIFGEKVVQLDESQRQKIEALRAAPPQESVQDLVRLLQLKSDDAKYAALLGLAHLGSGAKPAVPEILELYRDPLLARAVQKGERIILASAVWAAISLIDPQTIHENVFQRVTSVTKPTATVLAGCLHLMTMWSTGSPESRSVQIALLASLLDSNVPEFRVAGIEQLSTLGADAIDQIPTLTKIAKSRRDPFRYLAAIAVVQINQADATDMVPFLIDGLEEVLKIGPPEKQEEVLKRRETSLNADLRLIEALKIVGPGARKAKPVLKRVVAEGRPEAITAAQDALAVLE